jgi:2-polyprenyl-3-methyl-5-hydroxy-6-metoxy-1,4-benzoquinol methylase
VSRLYYESYWTGPRRPVNTVGGFLDGVIAAALSQAANCIDVGCGDGLTSSRWKRDGLHLVGVDVSRSAVAAARAKGIDAQVVEDAGVLPFDGGTFDVALCLEVFEHLFTPHDVAIEILRILRPGGVLIATVPNAAYWRRRADLAVLGRWNPLGDPLAVAEPWRDPHLRFFTLRSFERMLRSAGYELVVAGSHAGGVLRDVPGARRLRRRDESSAAYRRAERVWPALFGARLHSLGVKNGDRLAAAEMALAAARRR